MNNTKKTTKTVHVTKSFPVTYKDTEGKEIKTSLRPDRDYLFNTVDGQAFLGSVANTVTEKKTDGKTFIVLKTEYEQTYIGAMIDYTDDKDARKIDVSTINAIEPVFIKAVKDDRKYGKNGINPPENSDGYDFVFDGHKGKPDFTMTVYTGELLSIVFTRKDADDKMTVYGVITSVSDDGLITMDRYNFSRGTRGITKGFTIEADQLVGIFRSTLTFENYDPEIAAQARERHAIRNGGKKEEK